MRSRQLALAVIADGRHNGVDGLVVGDAAGVALDLAQRIGVLASLGVLDGAERNVAVGVILDGLDKLRVLALDLAQLEAKLAVLEVASVQDLGDLNLVGDTGLNGICSVGVYELSLARGHLHGSAELALCVGRYRHGDLRNVLAVGDTVDSSASVLLADLIGVLARLGISNLAKVNGRLALVEIGIGHSYGRRLGHRGVALGRQLKLKRILLRPLATLEYLGQAKVGLGIHRRRRHVVRKADLAVVAQVRIDLRCASLGGRVVPLGTEHVGSGFGQVVALVGMKLVNKGQACGSLAKRQVSAPVVNHAARKLRSMFAGKLDNGGAVVELAVGVRYLKLILVVIKAAARQLSLRGQRAGGIRVNGRLLLEEVVTVGGGGRKVGDRVAQVLVTPLVGIEGNGLGALLAGRILLDVLLQRLIRGEQVFARDSLDARSVLHADGLDVVDCKRALGLVDVKFAQRNQRRRDLDLYDVALLRVILCGALNGDDQIRSFAGKSVGVDITRGGRILRALKRLAVVFDLGEAIDLHKVAQLIGKRNVAGLMLAIAVVDFGRIANDLGDALRDVLKDVLELLGVFRRLVVIGVFCARTKVDGPLAPVRNVGRGGRIVARHGVHELILVNRAGGRGIGTGIRAAKDANGVNDGAVFLQAVCLVDGAIGNRGLKAVVARGRTIGKEQDDLLGVFAARNALGKIHAIVGTRGAGRGNGADRALKALRILAQAKRQGFHGLRIVVSVAAFTISTVADLLSLIARELYNGDLMPLGLVRDLCIFFGNLVYKAIGCGL